MNQSDNREATLEQSAQDADGNFSSRTINNASQPCESKKSEPKTAWIEITLVDDMDAPVSHEPYRVQDPDGNLLEGQLDQNGTARIEDIPPGICLVKFPNIDSRDWKFPASEEQAEATKTDWVEIELKDDQDRPVPGEPYRVRCPDGEIREGTLDENGFVRVENIMSGRCVITFPEIDARDWVLSG